MDNQQPLGIDLKECCFSMSKYQREVIMKKQTTQVDKIKIFSHCKWTLDLTSQACSRPQPLPTYASQCLPNTAFPLFYQVATKTPRSIKGQNRSPRNYACLPKILHGESPVAGSRSQALGNPRPCSA